MFASCYPGGSLSFTFRRTRQICRMYYLGVFPAKSRASAEAAQILQLTDSVLKRHRAQREQGREDRSLVPVITYNSAHRWAELPAVLMKHTCWRQSHFPFAVLVLVFGSCSQGFAVRKAARDASHRGTSLSHETREPYLKARFQTNGGDRCHLNSNSRSRKTLKPLMFVFLFSGTLTSWCSANFTLCFHRGALTVAQDLLWSVVRHIQHISPQTLSEWESQVQNNHHLSSYSL